MPSFCLKSLFTQLPAQIKNLGLTALMVTTLPFMASSTAHAESGVNDNRILLGQSAAFSGPAAQLGIQLHTGAKVYFDALNDRGGIHGRKIEIITADDKYEPELAAWNTKKLIETNDVFALFGYVGTPTSNAALPIFTKAKVPFFAPFTGAQSLREPFSREIFHIRSSYNDETEHLVRGLVKNGMKNIAVFYQDDAYGKAGLAGVERALKLFNLPMPVTATVMRNSTDVKAAVNKILPSKPDAIIQVSTYTTCAAFVQAMRSSNYMGLFYNLSFVGSQALADALGDAGAGTIISQVVPFPWGQGTPVVAEFHKAMKKAGKEKDINFSSLEGYLAAKIFTEGLRRTGRDLTRQRFIRALETIDSNDYDAGGFTVHFSPTNHNGSRFVDMTAISKNNKFSH
ncbi:MAG: hypothetical protein RL748_3215 [Pseudomonadota bacterium]|jgi:ABC-type branched-subunit amino acid transport system substrate-binding protein